MLYKANKIFFVVAKPPRNFGEFSEQFSTESMLYTGELFFCLEQCQNYYISGGGPANPALLFKILTLRGEVKYFPVFPLNNMEKPFEKL